MGAVRFQFVVGFCASWVWACGAETPPAEAPPEPVRGAKVVRHAEPVATEGAAKVSADTPACVDGLLDAPERWLVSRAGALTVDLGRDGAAAFSLGGWQTQLGGVVRVEETRGLLVPGTLARVLVPFERGGQHRVRFWVRALVSGPGTVYLDDTVVREVTLDAKAGLSAVDVDVTVDGPGDRTFQIRAPKVAAAHGVEGSLVLARIEVDSMGGAPRGEPPAGFGPLPTFTPGAARPLGPGVTFHTTREIPKDAVLRVRATGGDAEVTVRADGVPPLGHVSSAGDLDLTAWAGRIARLEFTASKPGVELVEASLRRPKPTPGAFSPRPMNVLVFLIDTLRADKLKVVRASSRVKTPATDALAARAANFIAGHTHENWTKPSVASLLSGLLPWQHQATTGDAVVPEDVDLLSERLQRAGYYTGTFIANGYVSDKFGFKQGWHTYRNYIREGRRTQANFVAADVLEWLDKRPKDKPFFLYVHTIDPHVPYIPPKDFVTEYDPEPYDGIVNFHRDRTLLENIKIGRVKLGDRDKRHLEALYDAEITFHDVHMRSILEGLDRRGVAEDTLVVLTADHGEELFDHGSVGHGHSVWEELLHVPFLVRIPGLTDGGVVLDVPVGHSDVVPTILASLGMEVPENLPGRSLLPELRGEGCGPREVVSGFMDGWRTITSGRHKLVHRSVSKYALYDLVTDPGETTDVAPSRPIAVRHLRAALGLALERSRGGGRRGAPAKRTTTNIDATTRAQLEALGYVGTQAK